MIKRTVLRFKISLIVLVAALFTMNATAAQKSHSWVDSMAIYGIERCLPPAKFYWQWHQATLMNSIVHMYRDAAPQEREIYMNYIKACMDKSVTTVSGRTPNLCASGHGMAFLFGELGDQLYWDKAQKVWYDYQLIPRVKNYGASHRDDTIELWDDTVYMLGMFFLEMYRQTGDDKYIRELLDQYHAHAEMLADKETGLWVHGWDADDIDYDDGCSQVGWADKVTGRSQEFWGRGNGWVLMTLADILEVSPKGSKMWREAAKELVKMSKRLPEWQDSETGMWYQLPVRHDQKGNYLESSCTAMFGYALSIGVKHGVLKKKIYQPMVDKAYYGLRRHATVNVGEGLLAPDKVCVGTCIGDKEYYYNRFSASGVDFAVGVFVMFGLEYEKHNGLR